MATYDETPKECGESLIEDNIRDYSTLIKSKDILIRFLTCMVENDRFEFICENNIQEFLGNSLHTHSLFCDDKRCRFTHQPFNAEQEYGVRANGEI